MAPTDRVNPWIGDQRRRAVQAREEAIIDKPISHDPIGETAEQKEERRKRREAIGQRYLAGRGAPFILSAQLKGPFNKASGWKNPWLGEQPEGESIAKENTRSLALKKALRDNPSLTGRQRNGSVSSVASTRSPISIGSASQSQSMALDRPKLARQQPAKPNLHGGLKHFLGAVSGGAPSTTRKLDRDNLPQQLPALKRKADLSWLKGADIVKKKRRELPDLPSPTPPTRVSQESRQFITPTNLLGKFRQHSQPGSGQETPVNKRPVITSSQSQSQTNLDIPTPSQGYSPPFKRQRRSLLAGPSEDSVLLSEKKVFAKSRLSQANRRSTSNATALADHAINEEPIRPLAARVRSLNAAHEVVGSGSFKFRRTKRVEAENVMETVVSSIERDDEDEENGEHVSPANDEDEVEPKSQPQIAKVEEPPRRKPAAKKPVSQKPVVELEPVESVAAGLEFEPQKVIAQKAKSEVPERRTRNSRSLSSDSETESPEKARLPAAEEQDIRHAHSTGAADELDDQTAHDSSDQGEEPSTAHEDPASFCDASRIQMAQLQLTIIQEVTETTGTHGDVSIPTVNSCTTAMESFGMDVVQDEMLHDEEEDTVVPDIAHSSDEQYEAREEPEAVILADDALAEDVVETTYVQMATGSMSTGSIPNGSIPHAGQSTAMNTEAIDAIKANLLEEDDDEEETIASILESSSSLEEAVLQKKAEGEDSSGQQFAQRAQATPMPGIRAGADSTVHEDEESSEPTLYSHRKQEGRPQISSSEATASRPSTMESQPLIISARQGTSQQGNAVNPLVNEDNESSRQSQYAQRQQPQISDSEPANTGTTRTDSQHATASVHHDSSQPVNVADPTVDDILRILRSSQHRDIDSSNERTPTQRSQDKIGAAAGHEVVIGGQASSRHTKYSQGEASKISSSPPRSQVYSHAGSHIKSSQVGSLVHSQALSSPNSHLQPQGVSAEDSSIPTNTENTGTTTTESLLLQAIAQDMAREDEGGISLTGLTESKNEKNSGESESGESETTPTQSLSQRTAAGTRAKEIPVEKSSDEQHFDGPILAAEVLQEPETQSWHISVIEDSTMLDFVDMDATVDPHAATLAIVTETKFTSSPPTPSMVPASVEEAASAPLESAPLSLSQNPWANGTPKPAKLAASSKRKSVAFSDHPSSSSVDDDDLDLPQQPTTHLPSSPPPRISHPPPQYHEVDSALQQIPIFSPPPVWQEPPSTESPFPIVVNGLRRNAQTMLTQSSQGMGMANAFLAAGSLAPVREGREDTLSPPSKSGMAPPRQQTPPPQNDRGRQKAGQSSVIRQLAALYPSSDEGEDDSPVEDRQSRSHSRSQSRYEESSLAFMSQDNVKHRSSPPANRTVSRVQVLRSPSTITDPFANPWLTPAPAVQEKEVEVVGEEEEEYDELPPFAFGNIMGMLGDGFGSSRLVDGEYKEEGVGQVADEMSDLLETWDVDEELNKARREDMRSGREPKGEGRSSARERVGRVRF